MIKGKRFICCPSTCQLVTYFINSNQTIRNHIISDVNFFLKTKFLPVKALLKTASQGFLIFIYLFIWQVLSIQPCAKAHYVDQLVSNPQKSTSLCILSEKKMLLHKYSFFTSRHVDASTQSPIPTFKCVPLSRTSAFCFVFSIMYLN